VLRNIANKRLFPQKYIQICIFFCGKTNVGYDECEKVCKEAILNVQQKQKLEKGPLSILTVFMKKKSKY
jgi:hypothetical protein